MQRATIIHNPTAGYGRVTGSSLRALAVDQRFRAEYATTDDDLDEALQDPGDLVVVAGGDGTVGKVARRLIGRGVPMTVLALGTANNVAGGLGISVAESLDAVAFDWRSAGRRRLDIWAARGPWGTHHFVESFGIGAFGAAMPILSAMKKSDGGPATPGQVLAHDRAGLGALTRAYRPLPLELTADVGRWSDGFVMVEALNVPSFGPALALAPRADPSDGRLQLVLVGETERDALADWVIGGGDGAPPIGCHEVGSLSFVWRGEPLHIDGRPWAGEAAQWAKARMARVGEWAEVALTLEPDGVPVLVPRS